VFPLILNISAAELIEIKSPFFVTAKDNKFCDFIKDEIERIFEDNEPLSALAFKVATDPYVGTLTFIRIYSGTLKTATGIYNTTKDKEERVGRMLLMHANSREDVKEANTGDIVALAGLKYTITGHT